MAWFDMRSLVSLEVTYQLLGVASQTPEGAFLEVGVYQGGTARHLTELGQKQGRRVFLCDTFKGMPYYEPDKGDSHQIGEFGDTSLGDLVDRFHAAQLNPVWVVGVFPDSMPTSDVRIAFAHLDCDQYKSVKESAEWLIPRMVKGGVIWFDDVDLLPGATRAAEELFSKRLSRELQRPYVRFD